MKMDKHWWGSLASSISVSAALLFLTIRPVSSVSCEREPQPRKEENPNIIFILVDDVGYGDLGSYGQSRIKTPNLDRMVAEGMRFTQFYAASAVCAPSRCALLTGLHSGHSYLRKNSKHSLRPRDITVAEVLKQSDYVTGVIGKWDLGGEGTEGMPTKQGFDYFFGCLDQQHAHNYYPEYLIENEKRIELRNIVPDAGQSGQGVATERVDYSQDIMTRKALEFVATHRDTSFFLYLAYPIAHMNNEAFRQGLMAWEVPDYGPYRDEDWTENAKGLAAQITLVDRYVGQMMGLIDSLGIDEKTVVMFSSDNGPTTPSHMDPDLFDSNGPLRGHKGSLYEGGIRVPFVVRWPGHVRAGSVSDHVGYFPDILPTLTELAGLPPPANTDGISLVPTLIGTPDRQKKHDYLYWELGMGRGWIAVRKGDWKAVLTPVTEPLRLGKPALFNLKDDIGESADIAEDHHDIVREMLVIMEQAHTSSEIYRFRLIPARRR
jgi:arylsulfatase A-like enzyme